MIDLPAPDGKSLDPSADTVYAGQAFHEACPFLNQPRPAAQGGTTTD